MYVVLFNLSDEEYLVETGDRIAQLIIERCFTPKFVKVREFTEEKADRGEKVLVLQVFDMSREQQLCIFSFFKKTNIKNGIEILQFLRF